MALAVVNYPTLSKSDHEWIQEIRAKHDKLFYDVVDPHFTLVFPTDNVAVDVLLNHVKKVSEKFSAFRFVIRCATVGDPDFLGHAHVFLIPDEGFSNVIKLHDALYRGILEQELRLDLPFVPHIGIASDPSPVKCKKLVDRLNPQEFEIQGRIEVLDIIEFDGNSTKSKEQIIL